MPLIFDLIHQWSQDNLDIVFFVYGLAFVAMGIGIMGQQKKASGFKLARILWLLAGFGLIHGTNELLDMWVIIKGRSPVLDIVRSFSLIVSYLFFFEFGRQLFRICEQKHLKKITKLFGWWVTLILGLTVFILGFFSTDFWKMGTIWARYLLGLPGGLLVSLGFVLYYKYAELELKPLKVKKYFFSASLFFLIYGILGGLIVPQADFFPANRLNTDYFIRIVHIPVQAFRAICAIIIAWVICRMLRIFNWEIVEKLQAKITEREDELQKANDNLAIRIQERTKELTEANQVLKCEISERMKIEGEREGLIKELKEGQELLTKQKQDIVHSRRAIKNVAEDLMISSGALEEQKRSLENINKELNDFTYIVSHDLKEPLRSIDAFSKFVLDDYKGKLDAEGVNYLQRVRINAGRMQKLIEDLLEISRIERQKNPLEEAAVEDMVEEANLRLEYAIKQKNARLIVKDSLPKIFCDRVRLTEVFINLVSNAVKFADKPEPVIEIGYSRKGVFYEFYVKDNGPGIDERYFAKIFEIFQRLGKMEDSEGTGAGLTIVKKIVGMHKGRIWVESKLNEGTTFYFTIPIKKEFMAEKQKIGQILMEKKLITEQDLEKALEEQKRSA